MANDVFTSYRVEDRSYLSYIKREIHNVVLQAGFPSMRAGEIDIIVSELCSNLVKHAKSGEILYRVADEGTNLAFEIFCIDNGPGIIDLVKMMKDGASTSKTLGQGLGAIGRLSDFFQVYTQDKWGTVMYSKSLRESITQSSTRPKKGLNAKCVSVCMPGEKVCGDGWHIKKKDGDTYVFTGDGLGHGEHAHEAVQKAIEAFVECQETDPVEILRFMHQKVKKTRGLVGTVAILNSTSKEWRICGIGNITTRLYDGILSKNCMSHNGIIGLNVPGTLTYYTIDAELYPNIIMYSDGLRNRFDMLKYPLLLKYDPSVIAACLFKDNARKTDDMTVLVGKVNF